MGLEISVGMLHNMARGDAEGLRYHEDAFARLSRALAEEDVTWREPETTPTPHPELHFAALPYGSLTDLRRVFVLMSWGEPVTPASGTDPRQYAHDLEKIQDEAAMLSSHLLCHSDTAGYYVPCDFEDPLFLPAETNVPGGGIVGSSRRLLDELRGCAPALGIQLGQDGVLSAEESARLAEGPPGDPFGSEKLAWFQLHLACRASLTTGHALVFH